MIFHDIATNNMGHLLGKNHMGDYRKKEFCGVRSIIIDYDGVFCVNNDNHTHLSLQISDILQFMAI